MDGRRACIVKNIKARNFGGELPFPGNEDELTRGETTRYPDLASDILCPAKTRLNCQLPPFLVLGFIGPHLWHILQSPNGLRVDKYVWSSGASIAPSEIWWANIT